MFGAKLTLGRVDCKTAMSICCDCIVCVLYSEYSNVAASSEGRQVAVTAASSSHGRVLRLTNKQKDMSLRPSVVRPSHDVTQESAVLAGEC